MKQAIIISLLFCLSVGAAHAQFELGAKGGINFSDVSNLSGSNRVSGHLGLFAHKTLDPHWCIQPELLYSWQGQKFPLGNDEHTLALDYIQIPVMVQYFPIKQLYVEFGPQLAFLTSAKVKMSDGSKVEIDDHYSAADFSINVGLGYMATQKLGIYARYVAGVTDITTDDNTDRHNRVGQIVLSYRFK